MLYAELRWYMLKLGCIYIYFQVVCDMLKLGYIYIPCRLYVVCIFIDCMWYVELRLAPLVYVKAGVYIYIYICRLYVVY